jgi:hypothetical protein
MILEANQLRTLRILAISACMLGLAGCGGGDDEGENSSASNSGYSGISVGGALLCIAQILTSGNDECATAAVSGSSESSGSNSGGASGGSGGATSVTSGNHSYLMTGNEIEPNNELINANVPRFATRTDSNDQTGWVVDGSANDVDDTRDAFALTPRRAYRYRISLCPLTLFWRLLDQYGNEITSSQGASSNKTHAMLDAGLMYYIVVDAVLQSGSGSTYR